MKQQFTKYAIAFLVIISLNFILPRLMPGDPIDVIYREELVSMTPELRAQLTEKFELDQPFWVQFLHYLHSIVTGDFGYSYSYKAPVTEVIAGALPWTLLLVGTSLFIAVCIGLLFGIESGWNRGKRVDKMLFTFFSVISGIPSFLIGMLLIIIFALHLKMFPIGGATTHYAGYTGIEHVYDILKHLILPASALCIAELSWIYLLMRGSIIGVINEPFILTGNLKGLKQTTIKYRYAARNALLPVVSNLGIQIGHIVAGALFIETVFAYPGVGYLMQNALLTRDIPLIQGILFVVTACVLICCFFLELIYPKIDPRIQYA